MWKCRFPHLLNSSDTSSTRNSSLHFRRKPEYSTPQSKKKSADFLVLRTALADSFRGLQICSWSAPHHNPDESQTTYVHEKSVNWTFFNLPGTSSTLFGRSVEADAMEPCYLSTATLDLREIAANWEADTQFVEISSNPSLDFEKIPLTTL